MKKMILLSAILTLGATAFANGMGENNLYFKAGANLMSKYSDYNDQGLQYNASRNYKVTNGKTKGFGYELAVEGTRNITDNLELGAGIAYQDNNKFKAYSYTAGEGNESKEVATLGKYNSIPLYLTAKYNFNLETAFRPYIKGNLGYSFNSGEKDTVIKYSNRDVKYKTDVKNGLYAGIGTGVEYNNFLVDLTYSINSAKATLINKTEKTNKTKSQKLDYGRLTLSVGYKFNF